MSRIWRDLASTLHNPSVFNDMPKLNMPRPLRQDGSNAATVAIVGAGIAGLRCADVLIRSGMRVTMFEARERIGGRVHQVECAGRLWDMGPNWIHGTTGNPIMRIAQRIGTVLDDPDEGSIIYDSDGTPRSREESSEMLETIWATIVTAFKHSDEYSESIDKDESLFDYIRQEILKKEKDSKRVDDLLKLAHMWGPFVGDTVTQQSLKFFFLEECLEGETAYVASTYKDILQEIASTALDNATSHFNTEITSFAPLQLHATPSDPHPHSKVKLTTSTNNKHTFDEVIITCPLGWLKRNYTTAFPPSLLPTRLECAINNIGYGRLEKVYVTFPTAFWRPQCPRFAHFLDPTYIPNLPEGILWNQEPMSLAQLPGSTAQPTLLFYIYGACATYIINSLKPYSRTSAEYTRLLAEFTLPFISRLPNYSVTSSDCQPIAYLATSWQTDPYAGYGSYTNFPTGLTDAAADIECMRDAGGLGVSHGIWLAGEHTAPFVALGTTTGAYWSGEGTAERICRKWGIEVVRGMDEMDETGSERIHEKDLKSDIFNATNLNGVALS